MVNRAGLRYKTLKTGTYGKSNLSLSCTCLVSKILFFADVVMVAAFTTFHIKANEGNFKAIFIYLSLKAQNEFIDIISNHI